MVIFSCSCPGGSSGTGRSGECLRQVLPEACFGPVTGERRPGLPRLLKPGLLPGRAAEQAFRIRAVPCYELLSAGIQMEWLNKTFPDSLVEKHYAAMAPAWRFREGVGLPGPLKCAAGAPGGGRGTFSLDGGGHPCHHRRIHGRHRETGARGAKFGRVAVSRGWGVEGGDGRRAVRCRLVHLLTSMPWYHCKRASSGMPASPAKHQDRAVLQATRH